MSSPYKEINHNKSEEIKKCGLSMEKHENVDF
jgi:hypothetical protein